MILRSELPDTVRQRVVKYFAAIRSIGRSIVSEGKSRLRRSGNDLVGVSLLSREKRARREREKERDPDERRGGGSDVDYTERATHINKLVFTGTYTRCSGRSFITIKKIAGY